MEENRESQTEPKRLDIAIIGSGPGGVSAAINAKIRNKTLKIFGTKEMSEKLVKAQEVQNFVGFYGKSGTQLRDEFAQHLKQMEIEITEEKINNIYNMGEYYALLGSEGQYEASTVILATGVNFGKPLKGEKEFLGRGVSYCATCDGALYKGKHVTVIAYSKKEEEEVRFLAELAEKVSYLPMYKEAVEVPDNVEIIEDKPVEVAGGFKAEKLILKNQELATDGIFILRESISPDQLLNGIELDQNHVKVDRTMATSMEGCFACGDIVGTPYQYIKAAGEGNIAALSAVSYLAKLGKSK